MLEKALFERLHSEAEKWRAEGWPCEEPLVGEILRWQFEGGEPDGGTLKYLRWPQYRALEVYWMLRSKFGTPHIMDLYKRLYGDDLDALIDALGVALTASEALKTKGVSGLFRKIRDPKFAAEKKIHALHEAATLPYPSYIFALAMGAGKTVLIGAIIASEFGLSIRRKGGGDFMRNALVFAEDKTILESLREIESMPYREILPPSMVNEFLINLKLIYTRDGERDIGAVAGSVYNIVVTNTAKIRLRANTRRSSKWNLTQFEAQKRRDEVEANLRLQKIASLPDIGVFSDEAHHLYGNAAGDNLKRVRETVNYINDKTPITAVVNTTGTPYYGGQTLKEVVSWYGLGRGIRDGILKSIHLGVRRYDIAGKGDDFVVDHIVRDFFDCYGGHVLPNGARPKIAFYFKQREHLNRCRAIIERTMADIGRDAASILVNTQDARKEDLDEFIRLNNPGSQKRVVLLVGKGVEGWNCPSLFACALVKEQTSNVFVLQAAARCLRQIPGNKLPARIYLDRDNAKKLESELKRNFGVSLTDLDITAPMMETVDLLIDKKADKLPKLDVPRFVRRVTRKSGAMKKAIRLRRPKKTETPPDGVVRVMTPDAAGFLADSGGRETISGETWISCLSASARLAANYHLSALALFGEMRKAYPENKIPDSHWADLIRQVEAQCSDSEVVTEQSVETLALIRTRGADGKLLFDKNKDGCLVHRIRIRRSNYLDARKHGLFPGPNDISDDGNLSYHYAPYNFDSKDEAEIFAKILGALNLNPREVKHFLFTGGLTDPAKTDFHFAYVDKDGRERLFFPDFVLVKRPDEFYIVEVKGAGNLEDKNLDAKTGALERMRIARPDRIKYQIVRIDGGEDEKLGAVLDWTRRRRARGV